ncbi:alkaline phosphatase D family protein [Rhodococcus chondri]|uniref:Alkaline phosphatase D family protein n=1 Tax=Rhodococcus chondri TaxID=3065941 RepID=A0ABU7JYK9_9NOCA|nr:alkaline phosphatase D family protein [Rhodococcus sp. CC-R104]MEE2034975.1 alkaline phosphatase D family protein [Rhodococcus sp. CC-R104]
MWSDLRVVPPLPSAPLSRRAVLRSSAVVAGTTVFAAATARPAAAAPVMFAHGVASGDPLPDAVILWTRVTPTPDAIPGSGIGPDTPVAWEIARDKDFREIVASGSVTASATSDHTVKIDATGLDPATAYFYRFTAAGAVSATGRTHTAPAPGASLDRLRFGVVSCANWEGGFFGAYRHLAARGDLFAIVHLGDYLYEYAAGEYPVSVGTEVRRHEPAHEIVSPADYRIRHGQYKTDPDLQALHAQLPWIVVWDDHEAANDAYNGGAENHDPATEGDWAQRKAASVQAYTEWMPVRMDGSRLYRRLRFGDLAELSMLDLRSYRTEQARPGADWRTLDDDSRTITGAEQMAWLTAGLTSSPTRWQLVGNSVMIAPLLLPPLDERTTGALTELLGIPSMGVPFSTDQWDGYPVDRQRLLDAITTAGKRNVVFLTGDIHTSWGMDIPADAAAYPGAGTVATEFVVPSVTSANIDEMLGVPPRSASPSIENLMQSTNRHVHYVELDSHGYGVLDVERGTVQMDWFHLANKADPATGVRRATGLRVADGSARVEPAPPLD